MSGLGDRVSYEDMANPRREGRIVGEVAGQWAVRWDEDDGVYRLTEQHGVFFHTTVTKHMIDRAQQRQIDHPDRRVAGWNVVVRMARCQCGRERPSTDDGSLAFFEFCGEGSDDAAHCVCGYAECAHDPAHMETLVHGRDGKRRPTVVESGHCDGFTPRGDRGHDRFYCGCRGWD